MNNGIEKKGKIFVLVAPSGAGKSTLMKRLKKDFPNIQESISCTTRPIREGEKDGIHYFFLTKDEFIQKKNSNDFLEWATVHSNFYGTSKEFVEKKISAGIDIILDVDVQGTDAVKSCFANDSRAIYIAPPSLQELENRLRTRATDNEEVIQERLINAKSEILRKDDYDYCLVNDNLDETYTQLKIIIEKELN